MKFVSFLLVSWVAVAVVQLGGAEEYHPSRTLLIDHYPHTNPTNFLFRGNMPVINGSFAYSEIISNMTTVAKQHNFSVPNNFSLIVVSYLNPFEEGDLSIERDFFKSRPHIGEFHNRIITGTIIKPPENDTSVIKDTVKLYIADSFDQLPKLMDFFRGLLTRKTPVLIYSHCEAGTDRTGEVSGAYYLRFLNMTFSEALDVDNHVQNRDMYKLSRNALQWYCFYLRFVENYSHLKCLL